MDLQPNKIDGIFLPITNNRISASEWNQLVGSCMAFITEAGLTPDASDNEQFLNAFKTIAAGLEIVGANTNLSNLTATGEARFTTKANTDLGNVSATGKATAIGWGMPDYSAGISLTSSNLPYTAPYAGIIYGRFVVSSSATSGRKLYVNSSAVVETGGDQRNAFTIILDKNDVFSKDSSDCGFDLCVFYPFKGAN